MWLPVPGAPQVGFLQGRTCSACQVGPGRLYTVEGIGQHLDVVHPLLDRAHSRGESPHSRVQYRTQEQVGDAAANSKERSLVEGLGGGLLRSGEADDALGAVYESQGSRHGVLPFRPAFCGQYRR